MTIKAEDFDLGVSKFGEKVKAHLSERAAEARLALKDELAEEEDKDMEVVFSEEDIPRVKAIAQALGIKFEHDEEEGTFEINLDDSVSDDVVNMFFDKLDDEGIEYEDVFDPEDMGDGESDMEEKEVEDTFEEGLDEKKCKPKKHMGEEDDEVDEKCKKKKKSMSEDDDLDEAASKQKKHTSAAVKNKRRKIYRMNKAKIKIKARRRRKTAAFKRYVRKAKVKAKSGRTASGKRQTTFI